MKRLAPGLLLLVLASSSVLCAGAARADDESPYADIPAFDREWAIAVYGTAHTGSYHAAGIGGRVRWQPFGDDVPFGLEAYLEATIVDWAGEGLRHDYPNGFNVFFPLRLAPDARLRLFLGFCDILSFVEPAQDGAPRADDVLFGAHAGLGAEWAPHSMFSLFVDLVFNGYAGHDRASADWTGGVGEELVPFWNVQANLGAQFHLGR
ncbi:MAG: hypothetical protein KF729_29485 [Sandaracinaceae bacterium]|nr:hypothetical protein [Sandaracinaceae bacterium]